MLECHDEGAREVPGEGTVSGFDVGVEVAQALADSAPEGEDGGQGRPVLVLFRDIRVVLHEVATVS